MRFKLDENLDPRFAAVLRDAGHDAATVLAEHLGGHSDELIYAACKAEQRTLITLDLDFANPIRFPVRATAGIIILRPAKATLPVIERLLRELPRLLQMRSPAGERWVVEFGRLRVFAPQEEASGLDER